MNYLASALPLNKKRTGEISDSYPNLFVPAGITFSIWGVIYLLLLGYCFEQFTVSGRMVTSSVNWLFAITCVLNSLWIVSWHYEQITLSLLVMLGLLISLICINMMIISLPFGLIKACFGIYLGWICIATIANVTALLVSCNWNGFGISQEAWTIIMISIGTLIAISTIFRIDNPFTGLSIIWAFTGIIIKRRKDFRSVAVSAASGMAIVAIATIYVFFRTSQGAV